MSVGRRHHVVSRGYLSNFALGPRVLLVDKVARTARLVGTRDTFVRSNFNTAVMEDGSIATLETEWARVESEILPAVRSLVNGDEDPFSRHAVKVLIAMHLVRSYGVAEISRRIEVEYGKTAPARIAGSVDVVEAFRRQFRRDPEPGEIEAVATRSWEELTQSNRTLVDRLDSLYNRFLEHLTERHVQLIGPASPRSEFGTGEIPAVHFDRSALRLGLRGGLAYLEADHLYMPLAPRMAAMITTRDESDMWARPMDVCRLNNLVWRASNRWVVCRPGSDPMRVWGADVEVLGDGVDQIGLPETGEAGEA